MASRAGQRRVALLTQKKKERKTPRARTRRGARGVEPDRRRIMWSTATADIIPRAMYPSSIRQANIRDERQWRSGQLLPPPFCFIFFRPSASDEDDFYYIHTKWCLRLILLGTPALVMRWLYKTYYEVHTESTVQVSLFLWPFFFFWNLDRTGQQAE